ADWAVFRNPLRSFRKTPYEQRLLPPRYDEALGLLRDAGVKIAMPRPRFEALVGLWWSVRAVAGDVIECGAFRGATSLALALLGRLNGLPQRVLMLDTFAGMPPPSAFDLYRSGGEFTPPANQVELLRRQIAALGLDDRVEVHQGLFSET